MTTQPEALRLADELDQYLYSVPAHPLCTDAAAELRRLSAVEAQRNALLEALKQSLEEAIYPSERLSDVYEKARAAIKAVEETK